MYVYTGMLYIYIYIEREREREARLRRDHLAQLHDLGRVGAYTHHIYIYIYIHLSLSIYIYIYIYTALLGSSMLAPHQRA